MRRPIGIRRRPVSKILGRGDARPRTHWATNSRKLALKLAHKTGSDQGMSCLPPDQHSLASVLPTTVALVQHMFFTASCRNNGKIRSDVFATRELLSEKRSLPEERPYLHASGKGPWRIQFANLNTPDQGRARMSGAEGRQSAHSMVMRRCCKRRADYSGS